MSKTIQLRNLPEALHHRLHARAAAAGMSLSEFLRQELERIGARLTPAEVRLQLASLTRTSLDETPTEAVRAERDAG